MSSEEAEVYTKDDLYRISAMLVLSTIGIWVVTLIFNNFRTGRWDMTAVSTALTKEVMTFLGIFFLSPLLFLALYYFGIAVKEITLFILSFAISAGEE